MVWLMVFGFQSLITRLSILPLISTRLIADLHPPSTLLYSAFEFASHFVEIRDRFDIQLLHDVAKILPRLLIYFFDAI
jgi:hypothetical protein